MRSPARALLAHVLLCGALPATSLGADGEGGRESVASAEASPVYFAINKNPFAGSYADQGFRRSDDDIREVLKPWREALSRRKAFPGLTAKGERVQVVVSGLRKPEVEVGWTAFETDSDALFWSAPEIQVRFLRLLPANLDAVDRKLLLHEAIARGLEFRELRGQSAEMNPNPPSILDPSLAGNVRVSAFKPEGAKNLVIARCEYFTQDDAKVKVPLPQRILLVYSTEPKKRIIGRIDLESPEFWLFRIAGDDNAYLVFDAGCHECDGTSIVSVGLFGGGFGGADLVAPDLENAVRVAIGDGG